MRKTDREDIFQRCRDVLATALPNAWAIYVFGSLVRGDERGDSDLDVAVLLDPGAKLDDKLGLMAKVAECIGRDVDIVSLRDANLDLVCEVLKEGVPLLVRRESETLAWEAERMTDYGEFNPRRSDILDVYLRQPLRTRS